MVHCFPYSKREGTKASLMPQVLNSIKKQREKLVKEEAKKQNERYIEKLKSNNICQNVLIEEMVNINNKKYFVGHSEYFVKCYVDFDEKIKINDIINCKIKEIFNDGVTCVC